MAEPMHRLLYSVEELPQVRTVTHASEDVNHDVESHLLWDFAGGNADRVCEAVKDAMKDAMEDPRRGR